MRLDWYSSFVEEGSDDFDPRKVHELVIDYLICNGYKESAELLCADAEMAFPSRNCAISVDTLEKRDRIRHAIVSGDLESAITQIKVLSPQLLTTDTSLHFKLLRQQLVELIRDK